MLSGAVMSGGKGCPEKDKVKKLTKNSQLSGAVLSKVEGSSIFFKFFNINMLVINYINYDFESSINFNFNIFVLP